jgi:hypothetical protein
VRKRLIAIAVVAAGLMAVAIGPGVSLVRCLLTGEVHLTCCCGERDAFSSAERLEATDDCCQFVHLDASWQRSSLVSPVEVLQAPMSVAISVSPSWSASCGVSSARVIVSPIRGRGSSPPLWLSTSSVRI